MDDLEIAIVLWDGVEELDFAGPYEVLTAWARESDRGITVRTVADSTDPVCCSHGLRVLPDVAWPAATRARSSPTTASCSGCASSLPPAR